MFLIASKFFKHLVNHIRIRLGRLSVNDSGSTVHKAFKINLIKFLNCGFNFVGCYSKLITAFLKFAQKFHDPVVRTGLIIAMRIIMFLKIIIDFLKFFRFRSLRYRALDKFTDSVADKLPDFLNRAGWHSMRLKCIIGAVAQIIQCIQKCSVKVKYNCIVHYISLLMCPMSPSKNTYLHSGTGSFSGEIAVRIYAASIPAAAAPAGGQGPPCRPV